MRIFLGAGEGYPVEGVPDRGVVGRVRLDFVLKASVHLLGHARVRVQGRAHHPDRARVSSVRESGEEKQLRFSKSLFSRNSLKKN